MTFYNTDLDSRPPPDLVPLQSKVCLHTWQLLGDNEIALTSQLTDTWQPHRSPA